MLLITSRIFKIERKLTYVIDVDVEVEAFLTLEVLMFF